MKMFDNKIEQKHDDNLFMKILIEKKTYYKNHHQKGLLEFVCKF